MESIADRDREWIDMVVRVTNKKITPLARDAGLSSSTLARAKEDDFNGFDARTINTVVKTYGVPAPAEWALGLSEEDARPADRQTLDTNFKTLASTKSHEVWEVASDKLTEAGFRRGDSILIDTSISPRPGDYVIAQLFDMQIGRRKSVLRVFTGLHLATARVTGAAGEILTMDAGSIAIKGVVIARLWMRDS